MTLAIYFGLMALLVAAAWLVHHWRHVRMDAAELEARIRQVDLPCFHALQQSFDARCLRALPPRQVRAIRRRFGVGALEYLWRVWINAGLYAALGQRASRSADAELATAGRELTQLAFTARLQASLALCRTLAILIFPAQQVSAAWVPVYQAVEKPFARLHDLYAARAA